MSIPSNDSDIAMGAGFSFAQLKNILKDYFGRSKKLTTEENLMDCLSCIEMGYVVEIDSWQSRTQVVKEPHAARDPRFADHCSIVIPNVTMRPILNVTVQFSGSLSRCPQAQLRDAQMSRFQKESKPR
ncbi:hypothetical protein AVEN_14091-1 [Araneus ventricosus]|uniref:Uncharacterized protein n=1 Tax=Araneus ventricosus TaxID=182803 RepID=A0A4Y2G1D2_ARAVE|nr:hypothetical protein AVEN_14091-1 [Araneus ventricosus]